MCPAAVRLCYRPYPPRPHSLLPRPTNSNNTKNLTVEQRNKIIAECCEDQISPTDLARKWQCNADTIRTWVRKAGRHLPKQYKKAPAGYFREPG